MPDSTLAGLACLTQPTLDALFWPPARQGVASAWYGHVPFAHWLIGAIRPRLVVELGTHNGVSFAAFCEAAQRLNLPTHCIAIDLWHGDAHAGFYGNEVYNDLQTFITDRYGNAAELRRNSFADALPSVQDGTIDLLHVDGRHRYQDVREDFESWRCKLSPRAVVLFHDVCEDRLDFGVRQYWAEISPGRTGFTFEHAHGLGVLAAGTETPSPIATLCALQYTLEGRIVRDRFAALGERWTRELDAIDAATANTNLQVHIRKLQDHIDQLAKYTGELEKIRDANAPELTSRD